MDLQTPALVLAVMPHGEHGAVVRFLTPEHGLVAGYVRGGRSRRLRPILHIGNNVAVHLHARTDTQLAAANVELLRSRAVLGLDLPWMEGVTRAKRHSGCRWCCRGPRWSVCWR